MINDLKDLLASLSGGRPLVVALLVIAICFLLLRPRRKQSPPPAAAAGAGSSSGGPQQKLPALSLSTRDILLEFVNGAPQLKQERRPAQHSALPLVVTAAGSAPQRAGPASAPGRRAPAPGPGPATHPLLGRRSRPRCARASAQRPIGAAGPVA